MDQPVTPARTIDLAIGGMTCASCVSRVEKALGKVPGVQSVAVNLATESAHLLAAPGTSMEALTAAVARAGYTAELRAQARPQSHRREKLELIAAVALSAPLFASMLVPLPGGLELALATLMQFWLGARFYIAGFKALRAGAANMDVLVALGTTAAYGLSLWDFATTGPLYFESSAAIITFIRLGKFLESRVKREAAGAITGLNSLRPALAHVPGRGDVAVQSLIPGDEVELRPGERVPADGVILSGTSSLDESPLTGESLPVARAPGEHLLAGALNLDGVLRLRVTSRAGESFLDRIARLIEAAQASKARVQHLADRVAAVFVPVIMVIAAFTFLGWLLHGATLATAIINAVSVLVIACPCALGLATPAAILAGTGAAARLGILLRNADAIETAAHVNMVVFDKTGTLTSGQPHLTDIPFLRGITVERALDIASALAASDTHPLASALRRPSPPQAEAVRILPGRGVEGTIAGQRYILGSAALIADAGGTAPEVATTATLSYLARADGTCLAAFAFADTLRPGARAAIERLKSMGIGVMLLSGDREAAAQAVGQELGIEQIIAHATPEQKIATIQALHAAGKTAAMVGDGVNDAPALAAASLGMAMGQGADAAIEAADVSLLRPDLALVPDALALSRQTWSVLWQGLFWAMIYNLIGIPAAAFGLLSPTIAGAAMAASSVCVVANALRLRKWRQK
ncbi:copper-translocating P-type ATPase [Acidocella aquatica]|uniref:Copper-translocating P-type ATPase n=1 Tax=Acidocella aquatica TaxID=1922313 RepID=A0ABQ6A445_9PROT|nr:cation-translocating P-type ATPase [Acidocella aquatica]GLR66437.1 copper-translocating P-type ATPase [Acidocella aquatica]